MSDKNAFEQIFCGILAAAQKDADDDAALLGEEYIRLIGEKLDDIESLHLMSFRRVSDCLEAALRIYGLSDNAQFLAKNYPYIEDNFNGIYKQYEGSACCADKSRTVTDRLFEFYQTGKKIEFNPNAKYTYHHPKIVLKDHDSIVEFFDGLMRLYYGSPKNYLNSIVKINKDFDAYKKAKDTEEVSA